MLRYFTHLYHFRIPLTPDPFPLIIMTDPDPLPKPELPPFIDGATILVDKPKDWTSFDVVNKIRGALRRRFKVKKIKVGHSGTLDPMATGLLVICTGAHTKRLHEFTDYEKEYSGTLRLGATTPSYDAETSIDATFPLDHVNESLMEEARIRFLGNIQQVPPLFSAIKVDGQPLYKKARKGESVEIAPRPVTIHNFDITNVEWPDVDFFVKCSKGTYIRSLAHDFGKSLNSGAYLTQLRRERVGPFHIDKAWNLDALIDVLKDND